MAAQYAGWQITGEKFFAMGSGPMRAAAAKEPLFAKIGCTEQADDAVGVLETRQFPPDAVCRDIAERCGVSPERLTLLLAPTASLAGSVQVVARSVETALHKLFELGFDLRRIESGFGTAPLPPAAADDLAAIGRTNDAILYGGEVTLFVRGDDASLEAVGPRVPSGASSDHGQPFAAIFERYDRDFYKIDPHLFSPARVTLCGLDSGRTFLLRPHAAAGHSRVVRHASRATVAHSKPGAKKPAMHFAVLCSSDSWYLHDLRRAAAGRHEITPLAFRDLAAELTRRRPALSRRRRRSERYRRRRRAHDAAGLARTGGLSHGPARATRIAG